MRLLLAMLAACLAAPALAQPPAAPPAGQLQEGSGPTITNPDWVRRPDGGDLLRYYPPAAARAGMSGRVLMRCVVAANGFLTRCRITEEGPLGQGFGQAALALAPSFQMRPRAVDGRPVEGASVTIPITWMMAAGGDEGVGSGMRDLAASRRGPNRMERRHARALMLRPQWTAAPDAAQVAAVAPEGGEGTATIRCAVSDDTIAGCLTVVESAPGVGAAALRLAQAFRLEWPAELRGQGPFDVDVPVAFSRQRPEYIARPPWAALPEGSEIEAALSPVAEGQPNRTATATLDCRIGDGGTLGDCRTYQSTPETAGAALLTLGPRFRVRPWSEDGYPTAGARVRVPLRYVAD